MYFCKPKTGEMAERSNAAVSKTVVRLTADRGFESPSLRQRKQKCPDRGTFVFSEAPSFRIMSIASNPMNPPNWFEQILV